MAVASVDPQSVAAGPLTVQWRRVAAFIGLTFGLAWTYNLYMALTVGYGANPALGLMLQGMMLIPAWSVLVLQVFVFADSPLHFRSKFTGLSAFAWFFLAYGLMFFALGIASAQAASPTFLATAGGVSQILTVIGLIFVIVLQFVSPALHGVNNQTLSFLAMLVYKPYDPVFSFGAGLYGLVLMAIVLGLLLLDKDAWK